MLNNIMSSNYSPLAIFMEAAPVVQAIMVGLVLASAFSWAIIFNRATTIRSENIKSATFSIALDSAKTAQDVAHLCSDDASAAVRIVQIAQDEWAWSIRHGVTDYDQVRSRLLSAADMAIAKEGTRLAGMTALLATIGSTAPFIGLFGTVWGIMRSFVSIGQTQDTSLAVVAPGIAEALMATAVGLFCAIPAVVGYNLLLGGLARADGRWRALIGQLDLSASRQFQIGQR